MIPRTPSHPRDQPSMDRVTKELLRGPPRSSVMVPQALCLSFPYVPSSALVSPSLTPSSLLDSLSGSVSLLRGGDEGAPKEGSVLGVCPSVCLTRLSSCLSLWVLFSGGSLGPSLPLAHLSLCLWGLLSLSLCVSPPFFSHPPASLSPPRPPAPCPGPSKTHRPNVQCLPCLAPGEGNIYLGGDPPSPRPPLRPPPGPIHHPGWRLRWLICHCRPPPRQAIIPLAMARQRPPGGPA